MRSRPANLGTEGYILGSHAASIVCEFSCVYKVELWAGTRAEYMRKTGEKQGEYLVVGDLFTFPPRTVTAHG